MRLHAWGGVLVARSVLQARLAGVGHTCVPHQHVAGEPGTSLSTLSTQKQATKCASAWAWYAMAYAARQLSVERQLKSQIASAQKREKHKRAVRPAWGRGR